MILTIVIFLVILAVLVFIHELGHFLAAKVSGVRVDEFSIGFPPRIFEKTWGETKYSIGCIPFGGYVKIFGEDGEVGETILRGDDSFATKPKWIQVFILVSGIIGNIILAWILFSVALMLGHANLFSALYEGAKTTAENFFAIVTGIFQIIFDAFRGINDFGELSGPVGIARLVGEAQKLGFGYLLSFTAFISLNLAVINLLPFPALDGGRILFVIIEAIRQKNISAKVANIINTAGFGILVLLLVVVTIKDVIAIWK